MIEYKASLDRLTIVLTSIVFVIILYATFISFKISEGASGYIIIAVKGAPMLAIAALIVSYIYRPIKYVLTSDSFLVIRPIGSKKFPLQDIREARLIEKGELMVAIRTFGSGGFFGYYGKYYNRKLGYMTWYTTQRRNRILIQMNNGKKIVISPDDLSLLEKLKVNSAI
jgi:hypothetical protein